MIAHAGRRRERLTRSSVWRPTNPGSSRPSTAARAQAAALAARLSTARAAAGAGLRRGGGRRAARPGHAARALRGRPAAARRGGEPLGPRGADEAEFVFSANPGVPPRPLRETASGGELSRAMLAIKSLAHLGHDVRTLIFDEVDTGIGGVTASVLGERLAALARATQIICITHLPQVAVFADRHFVITQAGRPRGRHDRDRRATRSRRRTPRRARPHARRRAPATRRRAITPARSSSRRPAARSADAPRPRAAAPADRGRDCCRRRALWYTCSPK